MALMRLKRNQEARKALDKALEIDPNNTTAMARKGVVLIYVKRYDEANEYFDKVLESDPNDAVTWYNKACLESLRGKKEKSLSCLKTAIELDDNYRELSCEDSDFENIRNTTEFRELIGEKKLDKFMIKPL